MGFLLRTLGVGVAASVIAVACSGSDFASTDAPKGGQAGAAGSGAKGGSGGVGAGNDSGASGDTSAAGTLGAAGTQSGSGGAGAMGGTAGGGTVLCSDAKDCDDKKPCTLDICLATGVCDNPPKCGGDTAACCDGVCSQCCGAGDCDDGLECTENTCFAGVCNFLPSDQCDPGFYCSTSADPNTVPSGCLEVEACDTAADCDDPDPCTKDACVNHQCTHPLCPDGGSCCAGLGCAECCGDSQCTQTNPCKPSSCTAEHRCVESPLCASGTSCCKSPDGKSASCGECCIATDCADDGVGCTDEKCKAVAGGFLTCTHEPNPDNCPMGQACDPRADCTANECKTPEDCGAPPVCKKVACDVGTCKLSDVACSHGQKCCGSPNVPAGQCQACCENKDCGEPGLTRCCPGGTCAACCVDSDCQLAMTTGAGMPQALAGAVGGSDVPCPGPPICKQGACVTNDAGFCTAVQKCCPGIGCVSTLQIGCPATF